MKTILPKANRITFDNPKLATDHPELHHYTTEGGLKGILSTEAIWATHFSDLNDASEVKFLQGPLTSALSDRFMRLVVQRQNQTPSMLLRVQKFGGAEKVGATLARQLVRIMYQITFEGADAREFGAPFIASFCSHADDQPYEKEHGLLSQWRGYGRDGGYCIVFDTAKLVNLLKSEFDAFDYVYLNIGPARYQRDNIANTFPELIGNCEQLLSEALDGNMEPLAHDAMRPFLEGATVLKHQGFHEEREVRIVAMPIASADGGGVVASWEAPGTLDRPDVPDRFPLPRLLLIRSPSPMRICTR
jgi:hypothetical protein